MHSLGLLAFGGVGINELKPFIPLGFAVGAIGTLLGAGGGFLVAPLLLLIYRVRTPRP